MSPVDASTTNQPMTPGLISVCNTVASAINKEKEKERRRLNLILHNLPESTAEDAQARKAYNAAESTKVFNELLSVSSSATNAIRLGKKGDKPRLLKVTVDSEQAKD